jgi:hypothetical protein
MEYALDMGHCRVDAQEFIRGVGEGRPIDGLLALWRSAVEPAVLKTMPWAAVKRARAELIQRIAALAEPEQTALTELARFADLFLGDKDVDQIRQPSTFAAGRGRARDDEGDPQPARTVLPDHADHHP